jgi:hypothetical protein
MAALAAAGHNGRNLVIAQRPVFHSSGQNRRLIGPSVHSRICIDVFRRHHAVIELVSDK